VILIRITNIGSTEMLLYFLKHSEDFELVPEPRWSVTPKKKIGSKVVLVNNLRR
jgi:hypothetical protein